MSARPRRTPPARIAGLYHATDAGHLTLVFDVEPRTKERAPSIDGSAWLRIWQEGYRQHAARIVDALEHHAPAALVDALLAELCARRASVLRVKDVRS